VVNDLGEFLGSVSGGCIEGAVIGEAADVIETGQGKVLHFGVSNEMAWGVGLACGGEVDVYLEKLF
jgi:xanthine/CO dehydrogenase XdhC/CoxF family maturation factor